MNAQEQENVLTEWSEKVLHAYGNMPAHLTQLQKTIPEQLVLLRELVAKGWELHPPNGSRLDWNAYRPSYDAPKKVIIWALTPKLLQEACQARQNELPKCHPKACCEKAEIINCVCEIAWNCPEHGTRHHGTHD